MSAPAMTNSRFARSRARAFSLVSAGGLALAITTYPHNLMHDGVALDHSLLCPLLAWPLLLLG
jgi:hypothetical protein